MSKSQVQATVRKIEHKGKDVPSEQEAEARLSLEGYTSLHWYDVPGQDYPHHTHSQDECLWILKGALEIDAEGHMHRLLPGDRLYVPAGVVHRATVPSTGGVTYLVGQRKRSQP